MAIADRPNATSPTLTPEEIAKMRSKGELMVRLWNATGGIPSNDCSLELLSALNALDHERETTRIRSAGKLKDAVEEDTARRIAEWLRYYEGGEFAGVALLVEGGEWRR